MHRSPLEAGWRAEGHALPQRCPARTDHANRARAARYLPPPCSQARSARGGSAARRRRTGRVGVPVGGAREVRLGPVGPVDGPHVLRAALAGWRLAPRQRTRALCARPSGGSASSHGRGPHWPRPRRRACSPHDRPPRLRTQLPRAPRPTSAKFEDRAMPHTLGRPPASSPPSTAVPCCA
jgi:hypothetical protein